MQNNTNGRAAVGRQSIILLVLILVKPLQLQNLITLSDHTPAVNSSSVSTSKKLNYEKKFCYDNLE